VLAEGDLGPLGSSLPFTIPAHPQVGPPSCGLPGVALTCLQERSEDGCPPFDSLGHHALLGENRACQMQVGWGK
jgi:hypothetical protein